MGSVLGNVLAGIKIIRRRRGRGSQQMWIRYAVRQSVRRWQARGRGATSTNGANNGAKKRMYAPLGTGNKGWVAIGLDSSIGLTRGDRSNGAHHVNGDEGPAAGVQRVGVVGTIRRPKPLTTQTIDRNFNPPQMRRAVVVRPGFWTTLFRLVQWIRGITMFLWGILWDRLRHPTQSAEEQQALRLFAVLTRLGGTFIKLGQQLAVRIDLVPYAYTVELSKLLDDVPPIHTELAIEAIQRATGQPLLSTFSRFDPEPIGSASVACVYQAYLRQNGRKVVVKVRRPGIGPLFAADFKILRWLFWTLKLVALLPEILTLEFIDELEHTLLEELDFYQEARHQDLFRVQAQRTECPFFSAPRVYFSLSTDEVLVQEFISGVSLKEILAILENDDEEGLARLAERNIKPKVVARRLLWVQYWGLWGNFFFHADPHPSNLIVQRNNRLVFIDFGSTGAIGRANGIALAEVYAFVARDDIEGAAKVSLTLMEPLPPLDPDDVLAAIEAEFRQTIVAMRSRGAPWAERTSAQLWMGFLNVTQRYQIPLNPGIVRLIRGTMLYDTLAARMDNDISIEREYFRFRHERGEQAGARLRRAVKRRIKKGLTPEDYLRIQDLIADGNRLTFRLQRTLDDITFNFDAIGKSIRIAQNVGELVVRLALIWGLPLLGLFVFEYLTQKPTTVSGILGMWDEVLVAADELQWYAMLGVVLTLLLCYVTGRRVVRQMIRQDEDRADVR